MMKKILFVSLISCLGFIDGFSQKMPLSYYSPSSQDTALKKYTIALLNASLLFNIEEEEALYGIGAEVIYFDDFNKNFYASLKTQIGNQSFFKIELGKKIYKSLYFFAAWEYNSVFLMDENMEEHSFSMPAVFGGGIKIHSFKQKTDGKSRALEYNLGLKVGSGTYSGNASINNYIDYNNPSYFKIYMQDLDAEYISLSTDIRIIQMKKVSKIGIAYSLIGVGFSISSYTVDYPIKSISYREGSWYEISHMGINLQLGVGLSF